MLLPKRQNNARSLEQIELCLASPCPRLGRTFIFEPKQSQREMCALYIKTREDIDLLHEINGLSIERIEARARPLEDRTQCVLFDLMIYCLNLINKAEMVVQPLND